jgi:hypothetical protein
MLGAYQGPIIFVTLPGDFCSADCKFNFDLSSVIEETSRRAAAPARSPKSSESLDLEKKRANRLETSIAQSRNG